MQNNDFKLDLKLREIFGYILLEKRTLQSIAFHLELSIDISIANSNFLKNEIVRFFCKNNLHPVDQQLKILAQSPKIDPIHFAFLNDYSRDLVLNKMYEHGVCKDDLLLPSFSRGQSIDITVAYLLDINAAASDALIRKLGDLSRKLDKMGKMLDRAKWFASDSKKIEVARYIFEKRGYALYLNQFLVNAELFFLDESIQVEKKELIFREIRARYNLGESRKSNPKKQCNFSIDPDAYALMEKLRKDSGLKRSVFLEVIFAAENKAILQKMIQRKLLSPKYYKTSVPLTPPTPVEPLVWGINHQGWVR
ncbi:hypothetical protein [Comamonas humi]